MSTMRTAVMQRHSFAVRRNDLYETPACAIKALIASGEQLNSPIWEPCAGRGAITRQLQAAGFLVIAQDLVAYERADAGIETPIDFLMECEARGSIVTNPPYKLQNQFIRHGLNLGCKVVVLLRLASLEGEGRSDLIDCHLRRVWLGRERLPMMHRDGWEGPKGNSGAPFAWFVFEPGKRAGAIELQRLSWRK